MVTRGNQRLHLVIPVAFFPKYDRTLFKRQLFMQHFPFSNCHYLPQTLAGGAGPFTGDDGAGGFEFQTLGGSIRRGWLSFKVFT